MSEITIRPAHESELASIGELTIESYGADGFIDKHGETPTPYALKLADARSRFDEAELVVAVDDTGALLGTVTIAPPGTPWAQIAGPAHLEFRMLAVTPAARGRGVGEALARRVLDRAVELGLRGVVLSSSQDMHAAHRIYERLGFHRTPEADWSPVPEVMLITYRLDFTIL
jgi:ribosomal protein S18 acetylase RimI-like enzyme